MDNNRLLEDLLRESTSTVRDDNQASIASGGPQTASAQRNIFEGWNTGSIGMTPNLS